MKSGLNDLSAVMLATVLGLVLGASADAHTAHRAGFEVRTHTLSERIGGNHVTSLARTEDGYIWIGTNQGLYRFDGSLATPASNLLGKRRMRVEALHAIGDSLFVGTSGRGVFRLEGKSALQFDTQSGLNDDVVWGFAQDSNGALLVATSAGVSRLSNARVDTVPGFEGLAVEIATDSTGGIWVRYGDGTLRYGNAGGVRDVATQGAMVTSLVAAPDGGVLLGTDQGVVRLGGPDDDWQPDAALTGLQASVLAAGRSGELWLATFDGEIWRDAGNGWENLHLTDRLPDKRVTTLMADANLGMWAGTGAGVTYVAGGALVELAPYQGGASVWAVTRDDAGRLWMASGGGGIQRVDTSSLQLDDPLPGLPSSEIWALRASPGGGLWAGTGDSGAFLVRNGKVVRHLTDLPARQVWTLLEMPNGDLFVGTDGGGLVRWRNGNRRLFDTASGLPGNRVWSLHALDENRHWVGTNRGLCLLGGDNLTCYGVADGLPGNAVWDISPADGADVWVSTDEGLARATPDGRVTAVSSGALAEANVFATKVTPNGDLWALSEEGLHRVRQSDLNRLFEHGRDGVPLDRTFGKADGLSETLSSGASPAMALDDLGGLWFATRAGLSLAQPALLSDETIKVPMRLESLTADGVAQPLDVDTPQLAPGVRQVQFSFAALSFRYPEHTRVQYRLLGHSDAWSSPSRERSVRYTNLPAGDYAFEVRLAPNAYGLEAQALIVPFALQPFWYQITAVRVALLLMTIMIFGLLYSLRLRHLTARHEQRETNMRREVDAAYRIAETKRRYENIFSSVSDLVILADAEGKVVTANPAATQLIPGCRPPVRLTDVLPAAVATNDVEDSLSITLRDEQGVNREISMRCQIREDGSRLYVGHDETERNQMERRVAAGQRLETVGRLTAGVAHDFNNLLTVIQCNGALLADSARSEDDRKMIAAILEATEYAADITRKLLSIGQRQTLVPRQMEINSHLERMQDLLGRVIEENITIRFDLQDQAVVSIDTGLLEQIVLNLVINARDAIEGSGEICIQTRKVWPDATLLSRQPGMGNVPYVRISVDDTGCGMSSATLEQIFEPFFTTKRDRSGTGLGLATVYGAVRQSGGFVDVTSTPGEGSRFDVYLPASDEPASPEAQPAQSAVPEEGGQRILLVEDNPQIIALVEAILSRSGMQVTPAMTIAEAGASYEPGRFDLIISDVILTDGSGATFIDELDEMGGRPPVLLISGYAHEHLATLAGDDIDLLAKPFTGSELLSRVHAMLMTTTTTAGQRAEKTINER